MSSQTYYFELIEGEPSLLITFPNDVCYTKPALYIHVHTDQLQTIVKPTPNTKANHEAIFCKVTNELYVAYKKNDKTVLEKLAPKGGALQAYRWDDTLQKYEDLGRAKYRGKDIYTSLKGAKQ